ncbi:uncharacterized protein si:dkey-19b23.7 isoform X6 [Syngnathus scovelli]|uniref:uncharacterized protein si:dkey-19b23.7 isoform X6 n=1 Tax=Syngnathus scovelli TaxID=161590 RepID=UPI00210F9F1A|nr:uncharacterized protein si:dkey-19b23.7 isoform X6 [Syngnathus scovelli]XP_049614003.1 uncharacterized protein si:dkey-19b23.7 isoform X6 [Syngnathus scovelli]XP_049614012.1 uncharacterized protein si:dkey-19b23.7 isoform X6 [Syngnathus scovelli]XP_049614022.1 uncharacterized protein si:dkey-19b23.7 isoform X6 [Syngnathus scovelli]
MALAGLRRVQSLFRQRLQHQRHLFAQQQLPQHSQPGGLPPARRAPGPGGPAPSRGAQERGASAASLPQRARDGSAYASRATQQEVNCTLFLVAGYVKYGRPHAWIRSNHERLVSIPGGHSLVRDTPMKLKSIADWQSGGIRVWDVVSELVCLCTVPFPSNPLALDMRYIQSLAVPERFLVTGALLNFLETYAVCGNRDELHYGKVLEEVRPLRHLHVQTLLELQRLKKQDVDVVTRLP